MPALATAHRKFRGVRFDRFGLGPAQARRANRVPRRPATANVLCRPPILGRRHGRLSDGGRRDRRFVSSLRAVERAGEVAAQADAKLIVASAHIPSVEKGGWSRVPSHDHVSDPRAADSLGGEGYKLHGSAPVYGMLREALIGPGTRRQRIEERAVAAPRSRRWWSWSRIGADLLVVGDVGLD